MPETKLTWPNLKEHLRKYLWVYIIGVALCLAGTNLLWTMTRPRIPTNQSVLIYMADAYSNPAPLEEISGDMLRRGQAFDDTLKQVAFESMQFTSLEGDYTSSMVLMTRIALAENDAFLASADAMDALLSAGVVQPLDEFVADGWLADYGLEPYSATVEDEDTGTSETFVAGLSLDSLNALAEIGAFDNRGAFLVLASYSDNQPTAMKVLEFMVEDLMEASHASAENTEPAA